MPLWKLLIAGFIAGFLGVLIFHQGLWYLLYQVDFIPADRPAWPMDPTSPFGVPSVISKSFWGGLWGAALSEYQHPVGFDSKCADPGAPRDYSRRRERLVQGIVRLMVV
jgi:hypothetical protein